jgi:hypothetical protein
MRSILVAVVLLVSSGSALAQHKWGGHMNEPENQVVPNRPPSAVCSDGTLAYEKVPGEFKDICKDHKGIKSWVKNQFIGLDERILTERAPDVPYTPPKQEIPKAWLEPVVVELKAPTGPRSFATPAATGNPLTKPTKQHHFWF